MQPRSSSVWAHGKKAGENLQDPWEHLHIFEFHRRAIPFLHLRISHINIPPNSLSRPPRNSLSLFFDTKEPGSFQKTKLTRLLVYDISAKDLRVLLGGTANMFDLTQLQDLSIGFSNESLDTDVVDNLISSSGKLRTLNIQGTSCNSKMNTWRRMWNSWIGMGPLNLAKNLQPSCWKTLKTLNLCSLVLYSSFSDPYLSLVPRLAEFSGNNVLEALKIIMGETDTACTTDPGEWEKLDDVLSKGGAFPFLRRVEIKVDLCDHWRGDEFEDVVEEFEAMEMNNFLWLRGHDSLVLFLRLRSVVEGSDYMRCTGRTGVRVRNKLCMYLGLAASDPPSTSLVKEPFGVQYMAHCGPGDEGKNK